MISDMKAISVSVSEEDYEAFRAAAQRSGRSIAQMIREAMRIYVAEHLQSRGRLEDVVVLPGHQLIGALPTREEIWDEIFSRGKDESE
jgi:hypothetical protein